MKSHEEKMREIEEFAQTFKKEETELDRALKSDGAREFALQWKIGVAYGTAALEDIRDSLNVSEEAYYQTMEKWSQKYIADHTPRFSLKSTDVEARVVPLRPKEDNIVKVLYS